MAKIVVKLNFGRRSERLSNQNNKAKSISTSTVRSRKLRQSLKEDPNLKEKLKKYKQRKTKENKKYKSKLKRLRKQDKNTDDQMKAKQREWQQKRRRKLAQAKKVTNQRKNDQSKVTVTDTDTTPRKVRKTSQRIRKILPDQPKPWAKTVMHIISTATPRRLSELNSPNGSVKETDESLRINKVGRPLKGLETAKKKLGFSESGSDFWESSKSLKRYKKRKEEQTKTTSKVKNYRQTWKNRMESFLDENSRIMPNKKDTIILDGKVVAKRHLLMSKRQTYDKFIKENPSFMRKFSTFKTMIPKYYKRLDLSCRRVCVCTKDFNMDQKIEALNKLGSSLSVLDNTTSARELSRKSMCTYQAIPQRCCVDRTCQLCGTTEILNFYELLKAKCDENDIRFVNYYQWETITETYEKHGEKKKSNRWIQAKKSSSVSDLIDNIADSMRDFTEHLYRTDFQHRVQRDMMEHLPIDQVVAVMDFSENIGLQAQDEIESAHWTPKQVTLHPIFIVRHAHNSTIEEPKLIQESLVILSDSLVHDTNAVFVFTQQLVIHLQNNPGPCPIKVINRFSDNCASQYKCKDAFWHLSVLEQTYNMRFVYHYTESGHGKGPSDGIGAGIKRRLELLILGGTCVLNNAYQVYLALQHNRNNQINQSVIYVPRKRILHSAPKKNMEVKTIKGTQTFHSVNTLKLGSNIVVCQDLSCSCDVCIEGLEGPCYFGQFRGNKQFFNLIGGKKVSPDVLLDEARQPSCIALSDIPAALISTVSDCSGGGDTSQLSVALEESVIANVLQQSVNDAAYEEFLRDMRTKGWNIRGDTPMDGNCCFWAASDQLDLLNDQVTDAVDSYTHVQLRALLVEYLENLSDAEKAHFSSFLTVDFKDYMASMKKDGTYADHISLETLQKILKKNIKVIMSAAGEDIQIGDNTSTQCLVLGYMSDIQHYVSLEPVLCLKIDDFVSVKITSIRKKVHVYIAKVLQRVDSQNVQLKFLQEYSGNTGLYVWPRSDDISWQPETDIIGILHPPTIKPGRGLRLQFNADQISAFQQKQ